MGTKRFKQNIGTLSGISTQRRRAKIIKAVTRRQSALSRVIDTTTCYTAKLHTLLKLGVLNTTEDTVKQSVSSFQCTNLDPERRHVLIPNTDSKPNEKHQNHQPCTQRMSTSSAILPTVILKSKTVQPQVQNRLPSQVQYVSRNIS